MASLAFKVIGAIGLASYAAAYLCTKLRHVSYHRFRVVAVPVERLPEMPRGYNWRSLTSADLAGLEIDVGPEVQAARFDAGLDCLGVFDRKGELAGVSWLCKRQHHDPIFDLRYLLPANAAWDTGLWVPEDKRMGRAFSAVWAAIGDWLRREGLEWTMSSIADYNVASILSHRRLGARKLRHFVVLSIGSLQITFGARPLLRLKSRARPPSARLRVPGDVGLAA